MHRVLRRFRLLPAVIAVAALSLCVRAGALWSEVRDSGSRPTPIGTAFAADAPERSGHKVTLPADTRPAASKATDEANAADDAAADGTAAGPAPTPEVGGRPPGASRARFEPSPTFSQAELDVLQELATRRERLDAREEEMQERVALLQAAEARIDEKVKELKELQGVLAELIKNYEEHEEANIRSLVRIYENMKPKDAARIFEQLEMDTLLLVVERMKERKLAAIMAEMSPGKAKEVTVELARLRQVPFAEDPLEAEPG